MAENIDHKVGSLSAHTDPENGKLIISVEIDGATVPLAVHKSGHFTGQMTTGEAAKSNKAKSG